MPLGSAPKSLQAGETVSASAGRRRAGPRYLVSEAARRFPWIVDAYRATQNPRWARDLQRDLRETRASVPYLRDTEHAPGDAPVALVGLYRDNIYDAKLGFVLGTALRLRGLHPVASIPSNRAHRLRRYARAFGIDDVVAQDAIEISPAENDECDATTERLLAGLLDFDTIKGWEFHRFPIGNHVLSTLIRVTFDGSPDLALAENKTRLGAILADVVENTVRSEHLIDNLRPHVVLVDEANYSVNGPLVDVALRHRVDVIQTVATWRDDALMSKRLTKATRRVDAHSVAPETLTLVAQDAWGPQQEAELNADFAARYGGNWAIGRQNQPETESRSRAEIQGELSLDPNKPTCVIFSHVLWDASLFFGVDLFDNYADWLVNTVAAAVDNPSVNWIVKAHPSNVFLAKHGYAAAESSELTLLGRNFGQLPEHVKILPAHTKISTLSIYEFADVGVTVRGTPGMEIACFGKPAITSGTGAYSGLGFTYDSTSREEYLARLATIEEFGPIGDEMRTKARQYAHTLFVRRPWETGSFRISRDAPEGGWHPLDPNLTVIARSISQFEDLGDLGEWADWVLEVSELDFVPKALW